MTSLAKLLAEMPSDEAGRNIGPDDEVLRVNREGTRLVAKSAAAKGDRHVILSSSNLVVRRPDSAYAKGKLAAEEMLAGIAGSNGCKVSLFRIANVYGPGSRPFYNSVVATFCWYAAAGRGGELPIHGDGSQVVEFVPEGEVVEILCSSLDQAEPLHRGEIPGQAFSVRELGETITDPEKRAAHAILEAQVESYRNARLTGQKGVFAAGDVVTGPATTQAPTWRETVSSVIRWSTAWAWQARSHSPHSCGRSATTSSSRS